MNKYLKWTLWLVSIFLIVGMIFAIDIGSRKIQSYSRKLVDINVDAYEEYQEEKDKKFALRTDTEIYDKNNNMIGKIYRNNYKWVDYDDISEEAIQSYIAIEDKRFMTHHGYDLVGIIRAFRSNMQRGGISQGGSTITQQVLKNNILGKERSYERKLKEILVAPKFEEDFGKYKILEMYLNTNFYANNNTGIYAASKYYFNKPPSGLNHKETCLLIALSNAPTKYNPKINYDNAMEQVEKNLNKLYKEGVISEDKLKEYLNTPMELAYNMPKNTIADDITTFNIYSTIMDMFKRSDFKLRYRFNSKAEEQEYKKEYYSQYQEFYNRITQGGYRIYTSWDMDIYNSMREIVETEMKKHNGLQASAVVIDNKTQYVLGAVGGVTQTEFNRAFQAFRQPGSLIKPIMDYPALLENTLKSTADYILDAPIKNKEYSPVNVTGYYSGMIRIDDAMARSINTTAYRAVEEVGLDKAFDMMYKYRIPSITYTDQFNIATSLGGFDRGISPYEMAKAFSTIVSDGIRTDRVSTISVGNELGDTLWDNTRNPVVIPNTDYSSNIETINEYISKYKIYGEPLEKLTNSQTKGYKGISVMSPGVAECIQQMLVKTPSDPKGWTHALKKKVNIPDEYGAKTGTSQNNRDAWTTIVTPKYTVVVWIGYDQPKDTKQYGMDSPLNIAANIINSLYELQGNDSIEANETFKKNNIAQIAISKGKIKGLDNSEFAGYIPIDHLAERLVLDKGYYEEELKEPEENVDDTDDSQEDGDNKRPEDMPLFDKTLPSLDAIEMLYDYLIKYNQLPPNFTPIDYEGIKNYISEQSIDNLDRFLLQKWNEVERRYNSHDGE